LSIRPGNFKCFIYTWNITNFFETNIDNWADYLPKFVKVMPVEYRRALEEMARQQAADKTGLGEIEIGLRGNGK